MRLLLDQGVPKYCAQLLRDMGHECMHVSDLGMQAADDEAIIEYAADGAYIVVTLDSDFHTMLAISGADRPSVIRVRIQGLNAAALVPRLRPVLATFEAELQRGCLLTIKDRKTTTRSLPIL